MIKIPNKKGNPLEHIVLLRGVTPNGKNAIPKMSYLVDVLTEAGFQQVRTYIQSGNIILESDLPLYKKISRVRAEKDLYKIIFELLKEHNADPTIIKEKIIFE